MWKFGAFWMEGLEAGFVRERRKEDESGFEEERDSVVCFDVVEEVVDIGDWEEVSSSWWSGKCGSVKCVGGGWWLGEPRREMMQDLEWQFVERGIGAVEANWMKRSKESGDVGFMMKVVG